CFRIARAEHVREEAVGQQFPSIASQCFDLFADAFDVCRNCLKRLVVQWSTISLAEDLGDEPYVSLEILGEDPERLHVWQYAAPIFPSGDAGTILEGNDVDS